MGRGRGVISVFCCTVASLLTACGGPGEVDSGTEAGTPVPTEEGNFPGRVYERNFVFASMEDDSVFIVPWMMQTVEGADSVQREAHAWLTRGGVWDGFYSELWWTPSTRSPSRIVPHDGMGLLVRDGDAVDGVLFEDEPRNLEIILDEVAASWTGSRGGSFQVLTGAAYLADQRIDGMVLDMTRASSQGILPGGDWAFLLSGDSVQFVFAADSEHGSDPEPMYRGWGNFSAGDSQWPEVQVSWRRTEAFPPARRDVPVEWSLETDDGVFEGRLVAVSAEIQAGDGPGPLLPVQALFEVEGEFSVGGATWPVRGILVHERR
jgi:hypothetical protein